MTNVTLEKIDLLVERAHISYKEAKEALERHDGDLVEALVDVEANRRPSGSTRDAYKEAKRDYKEERKRERDEYKRDRYEYRRDRGHDGWNKFVNGTKKVFSQMNRTSFVISDKDKQYLDIPLTVVVILTLITLPFSLLLLILPYCFGAKISIFDKNGYERTVTETYYDFEDTVREAAADPVVSAKPETKTEAETSEEK